VVINVAGQAQQVRAEAFTGDTSWFGYDMVSGRWYRGNSQADVNTAFLTETGLSVGDYVTCSSGGYNARLKIVGEMFETGQAMLIASWQALGGAAAGLTVNHYDVHLGPGTDPMVTPHRWASHLAPGSRPTLLQRDTRSSGQRFPSSRCSC
jgi:putative ABC transport system permease protein